MWWSSLFQINTGYSYTQTNSLFQVVSIGTENENNRLISTALAVSGLFSLSKFARGGTGLLLLFRRPFRLRLLYRQKQNQCVRLFKDEYIKIEKTKNKHVLVIITVQISTGNHGKAAKNEVGSWPPFVSRLVYLPFGGETPGDGEEGVESPLRASLPALQNLLTAVTNPVLAANRIKREICFSFTGGEVGFVQQHCHLMAKRMHDRLFAIDLNCFSLHMNWMSPSSSGSLHFSSSVEQSTTSGSRNKPLASLYSQSSGEGCFCTTATRTGGGKIQSQIEASSGRRTAAGIYVRSGRCCRGFPRWSRAA